jgi:hypothetical protein
MKRKTTKSSVDRALGIGRRDLLRAAAAGFVGAAAAAGARVGAAAAATKGASGSRPHIHPTVGTPPRSRST